MKGENKKDGIKRADIVVVLVIIAILLAALVPVMHGWGRTVQESAVRTEGRIYLYAAMTVAEEAIEEGAWVRPTVDTGSECYDGILASPVFAEIIEGSKLVYLPASADGFPHIRDIFVIGNNPPTAVFVRNVLRDGTMTSDGLIVGNTPEGGFWLRGGVEEPAAFTPAG